MAPATMATGSDSDKVLYSSSARRSSPAATSAPPIPAPTPTPARRTVHFTLTDEAGNRFWDYTSANVGKYMAIVMGGRVREVAVIKSGIRDTGEIEGAFYCRRSHSPLEDAAHRRAAGFAHLS